MNLYTLSKINLTLLIILIIKFNIVYFIRLLSGSEILILCRSGDMKHSISPHTCTDFYDIVHMINSHKALIFYTQSYTPERAEES